MNKKYGCDVVEYEELTTFFGQKFIDDLKKFGVSEILRLNRRKKGLTSSGSELQCHMNVLSLVSAFGGRHKNGFLIEQHIEIDKKTGINHQGGMLAFHSAWLSPEKKLVCVTPRQSNKTLKSSDVFFFMFSDDANLECGYDDIIYYEGMFMPMLRGHKSEGLQGCAISHYRQAKYMKKGLTQEHWSKLIEDRLVDSRFSKKSILTKKSFGEIQQTPYAQKMMNTFQVLPKNKKHARKKKKVIDEMSFIFSTA